MSDLMTLGPGLLGRRVFDDIFDGFFADLPRHIQQSTQGYPVVDIYVTEDGSTVMEFALAGFSKDELDVDVRPDKSSITVSAEAGTRSESTANRRIAKRSFNKTYVNYDNNLDLTNIAANFENGLLTITVPTRPEIKPLKVEIN